MKAAERFIPPEAELKLGKRRITDYGKHSHGTIEIEDASIPVTLREPPKRKQSGRGYVVATGWLGEKSSMRHAAHEVVRAGHVALTFDYRSVSAKQALGHNAGDLAAAIDSMPAGLSRHAIVLSMSGRVLPDALNRARADVKSATLVVPAGYIEGEHSRLKAARHLAATVPEVVEMALQHPVDAAYWGFTAWRNFLRRPLAVSAEFEEMRHGTAQDSLHAVKNRPNPPNLNYFYGDGDRLFPAWAQAEAAAVLPFDHVEMYHGGHMALLHSTGLIQRILEVDDRQLAAPAGARESGLAAAA